MADLTVSSPVDSFMQSTSEAQMRDRIGLNDEVGPQFAARAPRPGVISAGTSVLATTQSNTSLATGTSATTEALFLRLADWTPASTITVLAKNSSNLGTILYVLTNGKLRISIGTGSTYSSYDSTVATGLVDGSWALVTASMTPAGSVVFGVNGSQLGDPVDISSLSAVTRTNTGNRIYGATGTITLGESFLASGALTAAQIATIHANGTAVGMGLTMYQHLVPSESLAAGIFRDVSGNSNHAVLGTTGITLTHTYNLPSAPVAQALVGDGASGTGIYATLGTQAPGTGDLAIVTDGFLYGPPSAGFDWVSVLSSSASAGYVARSFGFYITSLGVRLIFFGATTSDYIRLAAGTELLTKLQATRSLLAATRDSTGVKVFANFGTGQMLNITNLFTEGSANGPVAWTDTITGTYLLGFDHSALTGAAQTLHALELLNTAPTLAEFEYRVRNGAWEPKFAKGETDAYVSDFSTSDGWNTATGIIAAYNETLGAESGVAKWYADGGTGTHRVYRGVSALGAGTSSDRITFRYYMPSANTNVKKLYLFFTSGSAITFTPTYDAWTDYEWVPLSKGSGIFQIYLSSASSTSFTGANSATDDLLYIASVVTDNLGVTTALDLSDGGGYQPKNPRAENGSSHWTMSTTGISWRNPNRIGKTIIGTLTNSGTAQQITGASVIPSGWEIVRIRAKADSGTPNIIVGSATGLSDIVASEALSTSWKSLTLVGGPQITTTANLWATLSTAVGGRIEFEIQPRGTI